MTEKPTLARLSQQLERSEQRLVELENKVLSERTLAKWLTKPSHFSVILAAMTLIVTYFSWLQPQWSAHNERDHAMQVARQIDEKLKDSKLDEVASDVKMMKGRMEEISSFLKIVAESQMKHVANLSPNEFRTSLGKVKMVLVVAKETNATTPKGTLDTIKGKIISTSTNAPNYWPTASAFINYISPIPLNRPPLCEDQPPASGFVSIKSGVVDFSPASLVPSWQNCSLDLNKPMPIMMVALLNKSKPLRITTIACAGCTIIYRAGDIPILDSKLITKLILVRCNFELEPDSQPPVRGQRLISALLKARTISKVDIEART